MRVNLLGPLEVYADDACVNAVPGAQKIRQTLAVLALKANRVVRSGLLMDELWEDGPPASAHTALQTYVYQIRKRFELGNPRSGYMARGTETAALSTVDGGYLLSLPGEHLDAFRFEPLVSRARKDFRAGDFLRARESVATALALWRDAALVDVRKGTVLAAEALRLNELHTSANNLRIETDLHLGRHHELVSELTPLATLEPTNEGLQRALMTALYRIDRRADALRVYQRAREAIADELGLDPSSELQALHTAILTSDDSLLQPLDPSPAVAASAPGLQVPCHVPTPYDGAVTGRRVQLTRIVNALTAKVPAGRALVLVGGPPGTGKSELCLHAAQQVSGYYPDGQLFGQLLDGAGRRTSHAAILRSFLRGLGATDEQLRRNVTDLRLMFRTWTANRRVLVVLDDVTSAKDLELLPSGLGCGAVISSRRRLFVSSGTEHIELDRLSLDDSLSMLTCSVPNHRVTMAPEGVRQLIELCCGLPKALFAVASKLRVRPHWTARQAISWVVASGQAGEDPLTMRASLGRTLATAPSDVRTAVDTMLSPRSPALLNPGSAATVLGIGEHRAEALLEELVESYLLRASEPCVNGRFSYQWEPAGQALRGHPGAPGWMGDGSEIGVRQSVAA